MHPKRQEKNLAAIPVGTADVRLFSLSGGDRLSLIFRRAGFALADTPEDAAGRDAVLIAHAGYIFDERVIADFSEHRDAALLAEDGSGREVVVAAICRPAQARRWVDIVARETPATEAASDGAVKLYSVGDVSGAFNRRLRKKETPIVEKATLARKDALERRLFKGSYKGATDIVTKFVWPAPAFHATRMTAALGVHPNHITTLSLIFVFATIYLFAQGQFLAGLAAGWFMCFLDTVDGKLARVTLKSSKWGNLYDHGIDLIHPPFWYAAWAYGLMTAGPEAYALPSDAVWTSLWIIFAGYVAGRLLEGYFLRRFKLEMHIWRPVDYWFRHITARRNPNLLILTVAALLGAPAIGFALVAAWTVLSLVFHLGRLLTAEAQGSGALQSWLAE